MSGVDNYKELLDKLGMHRISSGSYIYINSIKDIDFDILKIIISTSVADMKKIYNVEES